MCLSCFYGQGNPPSIEPEYVQNVEGDVVRQVRGREYLLLPAAAKDKDPFVSEGEPMELKRFHVNYSFDKVFSGRASSQASFEECERSTYYSCCCYNNKPYRHLVLLRSFRLTYVLRM